MPQPTIWIFWRDAMKLCPHCAFIYEDDQRFCDMDGKELVHDPAPVVVEQSVSAPTSLKISLPARSQSRRFPVLVIGAIALATLLSVIYFAQLHRSRPSDAAHSSVQSPEQSMARDTSAEPSPADLVSSTSTVDTPLPEQLPGHSPEQSPLRRPTMISSRRRSPIST